MLKDIDNYGWCTREDAQRVVSDIEARDVTMLEYQAKIIGYLSHNLQGLWSKEVGDLLDYYLKVYRDVRDH